MRVPGTSGRREFRINTGMLRSTAGMTVAGGRTFAPKEAGSAGSGDDAGAGDFGSARVQDQHRDVALDGRNDCGGVKDFRTEVGELRGFCERDGLDAMAAGENGGIGSEHAVNVGPDLDFLRVDAGP